MFVSLPIIVIINIWKFFVTTGADWFTKIITLSITQTVNIMFTVSSASYNLPLRDADVAIVVVAVN